MFLIKTNKNFSGARVGKKIAMIFVIAVLVFTSAENFSGKQVWAADDAGEIQDKLENLQKKQEKTEAELNTAQTLLNQNQYKMNVTQNIIETTEETISRKEKELDNLEKRSKLQKMFLEEYIRDLYYNDQEDPLVVLTVQKTNLNNIVGAYDSVLTIKENLLETLSEIKQLSDETEKVRAELEGKKQDHEKLLVTQQVQANVLSSDVKEAKMTLAEINAKISKLRSALSAFLGKSFTIDDVVREVKYASGKTGVRKEFLFAMLDKETDLGRFTGGCYYDKGSNPVKKHMKSADQSAFLDLMDELGYGKNDQKLSCWPGYGYGGAMGIAQFMPTTWLGYKDAIKKYTGHNPPNPWNITDGIIGMAEKLKRAGASSKSKEHYAAKVYYCGGPSSPYWNTRCEAYADTVISWSKGYDEYF